MTELAINPRLPRPSANRDNPRPCCCVSAGDRTIARDVAGLGSKSVKLRTSKCCPICAPIAAIAEPCWHFRVVPKAAIDEPRPGVLYSARCQPDRTGHLAHRRCAASSNIEAPILSPFEIFGDCTQAHLEENRPWLVPRFQDAASGILVIAIQSFLIRRNGLTILVDACGGNDKERARPHFHRRNWPWLDTLRSAGVTPEDIDVVLCTHLHVDHVGCNTRLENGRWVPTFPNARYLIAQREWDYWRAAGPAAFAFTGEYISDSVLPIFKAGQADLIGDEHILASDIALEPAPGHTPGLTLVRLGGGRREAILCSYLSTSAASALSDMEHALLHRSQSGTADAYRILQKTR